MNQNELSDQLTILIFKDNAVARTFKVSLRWISRLGFLTAVGLLILLGCLALSIQLYRSTPAGSARMGADTDTTFPLDALKQITAFSADEETVSENSVAPLLFQALPNKIRAVNAKEGPAIQIDNLKLTWTSQSWNVRFLIENVRDNGALQQGIIVILARGPGALLTYPKGVLAPPGSGFLVDPDKGETFGVRRFREVNARFGPLSGRSEVEDVQVLIFTREGELAASKVISVAEGLR